MTPSNTKDWKSARHWVVYEQTQRIVDCLLCLSQHSIRSRNSNFLSFKATTFMIDQYAIEYSLRLSCDMQPPLTMATPQSPGTEERSESLCNYLFRIPLLRIFTLSCERLQFKSSSRGSSVAFISHVDLPNNLRFKQVLKYLQLQPFHTHTYTVLSLRLAAPLIVPRRPTWTRLQPRILVHSLAGVTISQAADTPNVISIDTL